MLEIPALTGQFIATWQCRGCIWGFSFSPENLVPPSDRTGAWNPGVQLVEHPDFSSTTLRILAKMPSRTIGELWCSPVAPAYFFRRRISGQGTWNVGISIEDNLFLPSIVMVFPFVCRAQQRSHPVPVLQLHCQTPSSEPPFSSPGSIPFCTA